MAKKEATLVRCADCAHGHPKAVEVNNPKIIRCEIKDAGLVANAKRACTKFCKK